MCRPGASVHAAGEIGNLQLVEFLKRGRGVDLRARESTAKLGRSFYLMNFARADFAPDE